MPHRGLLQAAAAILFLLGVVLPGRAGVDPVERKRAQVRLGCRVIGELYENAADTPQRFLRIRREREKLKSALDALGAVPGSSPPLPRGLREEAYISAIDDSAQPFLRYLPETAPVTTNLPLLVFLHGYSPDLTLFNWQSFAPALTNAAETLECALAMPFGRSNTDFQGIGEQDVLRVIDEMAERYAVNTNRVVLIGYSMGGMGAWNIGARFAERFRGLMMISARGDYYAWHRTAPGELPEWRRRLVDHAFAPRHLDRLADMPVIIFHGQYDPLIALREARAIYEQLQKVNPSAILNILEGKSHWIDEEVLRSAAGRAWLRERLSGNSVARRRPEPLGIVPGQTPSRIQNAFLEPFAFVVPGEERVFPAMARIWERAREWKRFAKAYPRIINERSLPVDDGPDLNLFVFGEPENSPLIRSAMRFVGAEWDRDAFYLGGRKIPRRGHGLWMAVPSPRGGKNALVVQCGLPWGPNLPDNHRYDMLPDVLAYAEIEEADGFPAIHSAGFMKADGTVEWGDGKRPSRDTSR